MKKIVMMVSLLLALTGCEKLETTWEKGKEIHSKIEAKGKAVIDSGLVGDKVADKLKEVNSDVKTIGTKSEETYTTIKGAINE